MIVISETLSSSSIYEILGDPSTVNPRSSIKFVRRLTAIFVITAVHTMVLLRIHNSHATIPMCPMCMIHKVIIVIIILNKICRRLIKNGKCRESIEQSIP